MEILILLLLLRIGVCSKFTPRFGGTGRLGTTVALPPFPSRFQSPYPAGCRQWNNFTGPCGARAAGAEGRGGAGLGRDVYSLCRRPHAPRPLLSHWPLASQLLLTGLAAVAGSPDGKLRAGRRRALDGAGLCLPGTGAHTGDQSRQQLRRES